MKLEKIMSYDQRCYDLADHFLPKYEGDQRDKLAQHIQDAVEDWLMDSANWGSEGIKRLGRAISYRGNRERADG